jgi:hypothetical protein
VQLVTLKSAQAVVAQWQARGGTMAAALELTRAQVRGLSEVVDADWPRLVRIARQTGDPWLATDWPEAFDPMVMVIALCRTMDWACAECPLGRTQQGKACAHPSVPVTRIGAAIVEGGATSVRADLAHLQGIVDDLRPK